MKKLLLFAIILCAETVCGQDYTFKVLVNKGQNTFKTGTEWLPIKVGTTLNKVDELRISPNGYLGLVHVTGKPLEVKEAGPHKVSDLATKVKANTSILHKYTDFILSTSVEKPTNLNVTGSVTRGDDEITVYLPDAKRAVVLNDEVRISWMKHEKTSNYFIQFNSMFGDELDRHELSDTSFVVNLGKGKFSNEDNIIVKVFSSTDPTIDSKEFVVKKVSVADKNRLSKDLEEMKSLIAEKTALNHFYLANFYEQNSLLIDAATAYQNAIRTAPDVQQFRLAFERFIIRNGLNNPSSSAK
jgi:hypothetical protein